MKLFTKLFVAVVALFALSCATDMTEDLGVNIGGKTTLTLSLAQSRTELGALEGENYPLYWSEGDQISVNGVASEPLTASQAGKSSAVFTINGVHTTFNIAYPATAEGQVLFASEQTHKDNTTFGKGVTTLYGTGSAEEGVKLHHLTGVLKIGVTGSATLTHAQVSTIDRAPIAGAFDIDFASGEVTPTDKASATIDYSFGEGVALSTEPTYLHIAVPAGVYDKLFVTLYDNASGVMYATVKADEQKPLEVGKVRQFTTNIAYAPLTTVTTISNAEELIAWGATASTSTKDALLVADIDMTGKSWTTVDGFAGAFKGNGYAIKGLTAPLFGNTNATAIEGVHLEDVDIKIDSRTTVGALVCWLQPSTTSYISNCSAKGSIEVTIKEEATETPYIGGIVGRISSDAPTSNLRNELNIDIKGTHTANAHVGGCIGSAAASDVDNCVNLGVITSTAHSKGILSIGGICRATKKITSCVNGSKDDTTGKLGSIVVNGTHNAAIALGGIIESLKADMVNSYNYGNIYYKSSSATGYLLVGGLFRFPDGTINVADCTNYGDVIVSGASDDSFNIGGFVSKNNSKILFERCHNYGDIIIEKEADCPNFFLGGLIGTCDKNGKVISAQSCSNNGAIKVYSPSASKVYLGGFCGKIEAGQLLTGTSEDESIKCWNGVDGDLLYDAENEDALLYLGGAVGIFVDNLIGSATSVTSARRLSYFTNNGDIDVKGTVGCVHIGGLVGRFAKGSGKAESTYFSNYGTTNNGNLTISATVKSADCAIGGLFGFQIVSFTGASGDWTNNGKLTFTGKVETGRLLVGGITGATDKGFSGKSSRLVNTGDIECTGEVNSASANRVGGIYGQTNKTVANARCFCTIKAYTWIEETGAFAKYTNVGMVVGPNYAAGVNTTNCHVGGKMILDKKWDEDSDGYSDDIETIITKNNYFAHTHGSASTAETAATNFCGYISSIDATPVDSTGAEIVVVTE